MIRCTLHSKKLWLSLFHFLKFRNENFNVNRELTGLLSGPDCPSHSSTALSPSAGSGSREIDRDQRHILDLVIDNRLQSNKTHSEHVAGVKNLRFKVSDSNLKVSGVSFERDCFPVSSNSDSSLDKQRKTYADYNKTGVDSCELNDKLLNTSQADIGNVHDVVESLQSCSKRSHFDSRDFTTHISRKGENTCDTAPANRGETLEVSGRATSFRQLYFRGFNASQMTKYKKIPSSSSSPTFYRCARNLEEFSKPCSLSKFYSRHQVQEIRTHEYEIDSLLTSGHSIQDTDKIMVKHSDYIERNSLEKYSRFGKSTGRPANLHWTNYAERTKKDLQHRHKCYCRRFAFASCLHRSLRRAFKLFVVPVSWIYRDVQQHRSKSGPSSAAGPPPSVNTYVPQTRLESPSSVSVSEQPAENHRRDKTGSPPSRTDRNRNAWSGYRVSGPSDDGKLEEQAAEESLLSTEVDGGDESYMTGRGPAVSFQSSSSSDSGTTDEKPSPPSLQKVRSEKTYIFVVALYFRRFQLF